MVFICILQAQARASRAKIIKTSAVAARREKDRNLKDIACRKLLSKNDSWWMLPQINCDKETKIQVWDTYKRGYRNINKRKFKTYAET